MKSALNILIASAMCSLPVSPAVGAATPLWHWSFDDSAEPGRASIGDRDATVEHGQPVVNTSDFVFGGGSLELDGASNLLGDSDSLPISSNGYSVAAWIKPGCEECDLAGILSKHDVADDRVFGLEQGDRDGSVRFSSYFDNENPTFIQTDSDVVDQTKWYHVAGVWNPQTNTQSLYIDGVLNVSQTIETSHAVGDSALRIGLSDDVTSGGVFFVGLIDEAWVFNGALNQKEVVSLMNSNVAPEPCSFWLVVCGSVMLVVAARSRRRR